MDTYAYGHVVCFIFFLLSTIYNIVITFLLYTAGIGVAGGSFEFSKVKLLLFKSATATARSIKLKIKKKRHVISMKIKV